MNPLAGGEKRNPLNNINFNNKIKGIPLRQLVDWNDKKFEFCNSRKLLTV